MCPLRCSSSVSVSFLHAFPLALGKTNVAQIAYSQAVYHLLPLEQDLNEQNIETGTKKKKRRYFDRSLHQGESANHEQTSDSRSRAEVEQKSRRTQLPVRSTRKSFVCPLSFSTTKKGGERARGERERDGAKLIAALKWSGHHRNLTP